MLMQRQIRTNASALVVIKVNIVNETGTKPCKQPIRRSTQLISRASHAVFVRICLAGAVTRMAAEMDRPNFKLGLVLYACSYLGLVLYACSKCIA